MGRRRRAPIGLAAGALVSLGALVLAASGHASPPPQPVPPPEPPPPEPYMSLADGFPTALVRELMRARERVDIAMYSMVVLRSRPEAPATDATAAARERHARDMAEYRENLERGEVHVADALAELVERGVRVRVIYDHARENERKVAETAGLLALGARVYTHGRTVHHKFAVIDGNTVVTGSGNWSAGAFHRYDEDWIVFRDRSPLARQFQAEFEAILAGSEEVRP